MALENSIRTEADLDAALSAPYPEDIELARELEGDVLILGAGGKMGPTLVRRVASALRLASSSGRAIAVSRFRDDLARRSIEAAGAHVISADLLDDPALAALPDARNVIYMAGMKFGASRDTGLTWAMNAYLPGRVAQRFKTSRLVAFSTGNVYPFVPADSKGSKESDPPGPVGEYAQSCLGRERIFEHFSRHNGTPICLLRLNYAVEARYGVILDIAERVQRGAALQLRTPTFNAIWQGDANSSAFRALRLAATPPRILNIAGPERLSVRDVAEELGRRLGRKPVFEDEEGPTALLSDGSLAISHFGPPRVPPSDVIALVADWVLGAGRTLGKPTKFEVRDGHF